MTGPAPLRADGLGGDLRPVATSRTADARTRSVPKHASARSDPDERALLERARRGDRVAFGRLVEMHHATLAAMLYQRLGPGAPLEDLLQDTFARALAGIDRFERRARFSTWATSIALNLATDWQRKQARRRRLAPMTALDDDQVRSPGGERGQQLVEERDEARRAREALAKLPDNNRLAITMRVVEGLSYETISARMGAPAPRVRAWVSRGLKQVRKTLSEVSHA